MLVEEQFRGTEASNILFNLYLGYAMSRDIDNLSGSVAGGERTKAFFEKMGIESEDIELVDKDGVDGLSARFKVETSAVDNNTQSVIIR